MAWEAYVVAGVATVGAGVVWRVRTSGRMRIRRRARDRHDAGPIAADGTARSYGWRGHRVAYAVHGSGPPLVLVHSIHAAGSSWEWRRVVAPLARRHTVYTIDLLGFGRSDRPRRAYEAADYPALLTDFLIDVVGSRATLIANSLTAAYAIAVAAASPLRVGALVLVEPTGLGRLTHPGGALGRVVRRTLMLPVVGSGLFSLLVSRAGIRYFLRRTFADATRVDDAMVSAYHATAHRPGARFAPAAFVGRRLNLDVRTVWPTVTQPTLLIWGAAPHFVPLGDLRAFRAGRPDVEGVVIEGAGDLPHDEQPTEFAELVTGFLAALQAGTPPVEHR
jgi:pimeloyl-ACP methyl ester carboxylesterase